MARMTEMLKDLQQEIRLLKESRIQKIRDNVPPMIRAQPEGGSAVGGGANPQYLTLVDVNALLDLEREKLLGMLSHQNSSASCIPKDINPRSSILLMEEMEVLWNT